MQDLITLHKGFDMKENFSMKRKLDVDNVKQKRMNGKNETN